MIYEQQEVRQTGPGIPIVVEETRETTNVQHSPKTASSVSETYHSEHQPVVKRDTRINKLHEKTKFFVANHGGSALVIFVAGLVLLCAAALDVKNMTRFNSTNRERTGYRFGVAVGVISMVLSLVYLFATRRRTVNDEHGIRFGIVSLMLLLWGAALFWLTFGTTYDYTGNAFFAIWIGFLFSFWLFTSETTVMTGVTHKFKAYSLGWEHAAFLLFSITLSIACISWCVDHNECKKEPLFGLLTGVISTVFALFAAYMVTRVPGMIGLGTYFLFFVWWVIAAFILTFRRPFQVTGNGYFSAWGGVISITLLLAKALNLTPVKEERTTYQTNPNTTTYKTENPTYGQNMA